MGHDEVAKSLAGLRGTPKGESMKTRRLAAIATQMKRIENAEERVAEERAKLSTLVHEAVLLGATDVEVATRLGVTKQRVGQIRKQAGR